MAEFKLATEEEIAEALKHPDTVVLDVRTEDEIAEEHYETDKKWLHSGCRPTTCPVLEKMPEKLLPDKDAPVIVYCKSGRRANKACEVLARHGYTQCYNAGGVKDLQALTKRLEESRETDIRVEGMEDHE